MLPDILREGSMKLPIITPAWDYIRSHGQILMLIGMAIIATGAVMLVLSRQMHGTNSPFAWPLVIAGVAIYAIGRLGMLLKKDAPKKKDPLDDLMKPS
jgi:hypothetical protein